MSAGVGILGGNNPASMQSILLSPHTEYGPVQLLVPLVEHVRKFLMIYDHRLQIVNKRLEFFGPVWVVLGEALQDFLNHVNVVGRVGDWRLHIVLIFV